VDESVGRHKVEENRSVQGVDRASQTAILDCLVPSPDRNSDESIDRVSSPPGTSLFVNIYTP
jgi:hypothetical protein